MQSSTHSLRPDKVDRSTPIILGQRDGLSPKNNAPTTHRAPSRISSYSGRFGRVRSTSIGASPTTRHAGGPDQIVRTRAAEISAGRQTPMRRGVEGRSRTSSKQSESTSQKDLV